jgi:hypothetical protein
MADMTYPGIPLPLGLVLLFGGSGNGIVLLL